MQLTRMNMGYPQPGSSGVYPNNKRRVSTQSNQNLPTVQTSVVRFGNVGKLAEGFMMMGLAFVGAIGFWAGTAGAIGSGAGLYYTSNPTLEKASKAIDTSFKTKEAFLKAEKNEALDKLKQNDLETLKRYTELHQTHIEAQTVEHLQNILLEVKDYTSDQELVKFLQQNSTLSAQDIENTRVLLASPLMNKEFGALQKPEASFCAWVDQVLSPHTDGETSEKLKKEATTMLSQIQSYEVKQKVLWGLMMTSLSLMGLVTGLTLLIGRKDLKMAVTVVMGIVPFVILASLANAFDERKPKPKREIETS